MTSNITAEIKCSNTKENQKTALITGITGQDGSYLTELLLSKNYKVYGLVRPCSLAPNTSRIDHLLANENLIIRFGDLSDTCSILKILSEVKPDEIYNLASLTHVKISFDISEYTSQINGLGTLKILESLKSLNLLNSCKFYQASTSEMFGNSPAPQNETSPFIPNSPYANAKLFSYHMVRIFRESYNLFACNGILFNHESPRRSYNFVTRKITRAVAAIKLGKQKTLILGNLNAYRDWGHTKDYVYAMWLMVQQDKSDDFVIATGVRTCVRDFVEIAFLEVGIEIKWKNSGLQEIGQDAKTEKLLVQVSSEFYRPNEVNDLMGDYSKAKNILGWEPKIGLREIVKEMVEFDLRDLGGKDP